MFIPKICQGLSLVGINVAQVVLLALWIIQR